MPGTGEAPRAAEAPAGEKRARGLHWIVLLASAALEAVWAIALDASQGFSSFGPTVVFFVACPLSMIGLGYAMRGIPVSIAYAIWTGLGAALTVTTAMALGTEQVSALKLLFLAGIVGCVIGLKFAPAPAAEPAGRE